MARSLRRAGMSDARQSPIPQDRVNENVDQAQLAADEPSRLPSRSGTCEDQGVDELPGTNAEEQPGIPDEPAGPAEGGD